MSQRRISIKDIARQAGVSHSTVSRALRDSPLIAPQTRARIQALAEEMGYIPNAVAQSLQTQRTSTIGLVVTTIADPFFADVVEGVEEVAKPAGLSIFINASHNDPEQELQVIETFHRRRVDGIIIATSRIEQSHTARLARLQLPVVLVSGQAATDLPPFPSIEVDNARGARLAVEHLLDLGHRRIGYLGVSNRPRSNTQRQQGYQQALRAVGIEPEAAWQDEGVPDSNRLEGDIVVGQALAPHLWATGITALFCYNDMVAVGAMLAAQAAGHRVPQELSVIGFDNIGLSRYVTPALTTIHQPKRQMGHRAMEMLLACMQGEQPVADVTLAPRLERRSSTGPPS